MPPLCLSCNTIFYGKLKPRHASIVESFVQYFHSYGVFKAAKNRNGGLNSQNQALWVGCFMDGVEGNCQPG